MTSSIPIGLLSAVLVLGTVGQAMAAERYVVIIANNASRDPGVKSLNYADDDGIRYYELFSLQSNHVALFTVLDDETARLYPEMNDKVKPPTRENIFAALNSFNDSIIADKKAGKSTELLFVYAGHGDIDKTGQGYITLQDGVLRRSDLYQGIIAKSKADFLHLIIDACKSYFLVNQRGGKWKDDSASARYDQTFNAFLKREDLSAYPHVGVVLATSGDQSTHEWTRYRAGILSHELRSAIAGAGDINGDGRVEYSELHAFIAAANARVKHPEARLNIFAKAPSANRRQPLVDLREFQRARLLRFDGPLSGRYHIEDERGIRAVDLNKANTIRFDVALDRQRTYYLRRDGKEARVLPGKERLSVTSLQFANRVLASRSASLDRSFRQDLYGTAYSRGFYDGFCAQTGALPVGGKAVEFAILRGQSANALGDHSLSVGYILSGALLELEGVNHGAQLRYDWRFQPHFSLGATVEYGHLSTTSPSNTNGSLNRLAALGGLAAHTDLFSRLSLRGELNVGYQLFFTSGTVPIKTGSTTIGVEGSSHGFRLETGAALRFVISQQIFAETRGGLALELVKFEGASSGGSEYDVHTTGYFSAGLGFGF